MDIQIKLGDGAKLPVNAHESDTGYDVIAASEPKIVGESTTDGWRSIDYIEYDTNISVAPQSLSDGLGQRCYGFLDARPRSSISKYNLALCNSPATIDNAYRGILKFRFRYLWQPSDLRAYILGGLVGHVNMDKIYKKGDKIAQLIAAWKEPINWIRVDELPETARADGGFGSSGK